jgi:predicted Zn finger-like uncharacterized protein
MSLLKRLFGGADVNAKDKDGNTALIRASATGDMDSVMALIAAGADIEGKGKHGKTALMEAAYMGKTDCVKTLIAAGADVNAKSNGGIAALAWAAEQKNVDSVKALIAAGADVNAKDNDRGTALMMACGFNRPLNLEIVTILLDRGADPNAENCNGETALSLIFHFDHLDWASKFTELLVRRGARQVPGKSVVCPECGSPKSLRMMERGIEVTFNGISARFDCPQCHESQKVPLDSIAKDRGVLVKCSRCGAISFIPASVWCKTCGDGLSSGWQQKISKP